MKSQYQAPWSRKLIITTAFFAVLLIVAFIVMNSLAATIFLSLILIVSVLLLVRGYSIVEGKLLIHRLGWAATYDLLSLKNAEWKPNITVGSIRSFGAGGFFGYVGRFKNNELGKYDAYVTDEQNSVLLEFDDKNIVVSPDEPEKFVDEISKNISTED